jgi:hypothetical protein
MTGTSIGLPAHPPAPGRLSAGPGERVRRQSDATRVTTSRMAGPVSVTPSRKARGENRKDDPNHMIYVTGLAAGILFGMGCWAALIIAVLTGDFTLGGLLVAVLVSVSAGVAFVGWRRQQVVFSWGAFGLLLAAMALSRVVAG